MNRSSLHTKFLQHTKMRRIFALGVFLLFFYSFSFSQKTAGQKTYSSVPKTVTTGSSAKIEWQTDPFDEQVFIENNGQFDGEINSSEKILYGVRLGYIAMYFTPHKIFYRYDKSTSVPLSQLKNSTIHTETYFLTAEWQDASPLVSIVAQDEKPDYYTYGKGSNGTIRANIFKQITYKDIYPGIDIVYQFIKGKEGIKYSLVVHPGADISKIKISYSGAKSIAKNAQGDILINSDLDILTEHAPVSNYEGETGKVAISNVIDGNTESFNPNAGYDRSKTLIIDPWQTDPLLSAATSWDKAYDLDWDYQGNVYAYGGLSGGGANVLKLVKMNSSGSIQWTYNASTISSYYGDFCTDKANGTCYLIEGFGGQALKVNTNGSLLATFTGNVNMNELWRAEFDMCNYSVVVGGGGTFSNYQAGRLDTNMTTINPVNVLGLGNPDHSITNLALDPNGVQCYMTSECSQVTPTFSNNMVLRLPVPSLAPTAYQVHEQMGMNENISVAYAGGAINVRNADGTNGAAASPNWLYLYNGDTIRRYNKGTGALVSIRPIRINAAFKYSGIDVDECDNLFVGVDDSLYVMNSSYIIQSKILLPDTVFDVHENGTVLYACGRHYVTQITNPISERLILSTAVVGNSCNPCDGKATVTVGGCGVAPYTYSWSNGSTSQTATGLCAGQYKITVFDAECPPHKDTATVAVTLKPLLSATATDTNPTSCVVLNSGKATAYGSGGSSPYTYKWTNGATTSHTTGLTAGSYTCTVTDNSGCTATVSITLKNLPPPVITITSKPANSTICEGSKDTLTASGGVSYVWTPPNGLSCTNCPNPLASPGNTKTYTVTGTDANGCSATQSITVKVTPLPIINIQGNFIACGGFPDTLKATGGTTYLWSNSSTDSIIAPVINGNTSFTVTGYKNNCANTATIKITADFPTVQVTPQTQTICQGSSITLNASGDRFYSWAPNYFLSCLNCPNPNASPPSPVTYTVTGTDRNGCSATNTVNISVIPLPLISVSGNLNPCFNQLDSISLFVTNGTGYKWSDGSSYDTVKFITSTNTTYSVEVFNGNCSKDTSVSITVEPLPVVTITKPDTICYGKNITLQATGGGTYLWNTGSTKSSIKVTPTKNTRYIVTVEANGCITNDTTKVTVDQLALLTICCDTSMKIGQMAVLWGAEGPQYTWEPTTGLNCDTCHFVIATPTVTTTYTVKVKDAFGCEKTEEITVDIDKTCSAIFIPNAFSPGEKHNNIFYVRGPCIEEMTFMVFDRWGNRVFETTSQDVGWDGNHGGSPVNMGTYIWYLKAQMLDGSTLEKKGNVLLIR